MTPGQSGLEETPSTAAQRSRELYKYFDPVRFSSNLDTQLNTDSFLTSLSQLVAWRLNCQRAMVSLIDREVQYFVAESSKTMDIADTSKFEESGDEIWAGCVAVPKAGRLCEHTIQALPKIEGAPAYFEVTDLAADGRFKDLQFVNGYPYFKYYCGLPLKTKKGIPIGSIFALDNKTREPISQVQLAFMVTMAENCMTHLETVRDREDLRRVKNMNMCLAAFVDPENRVKGKIDRSIFSRSMSQSTSGARSSTSGSRATKAVVEVQSSVATKTTTSMHAREGKAPSQAGTDRPERASTKSNAASNGLHPLEDDPAATVRKATGLLFTSLLLDQHSGIAFLDNGTNLNDEFHGRDMESSEDEPDAGDKRARRASLGKTTRVSYRSWTGSTSRQSTMANPEKKKPLSEVLATSFDFSSGQECPFSPLPQHELIKMIKKFPRGVLCNLEDDNIIVSSSSSDEQNQKQAYNMPQDKDGVATDVETQMFRRYFPSARQLIFVPFWNTSWSRYSAFFAYNASPYRNFEKSPDFLHCIAFCHCITTELTRLATIASDQQKSDFIGSVSHELRSPLHGILASCEFLEDTTLTSFQKSLVDTADGCARTLLDTINMVLDYSKINAFERSVSKSRKSKRRKNILSTAHLRPALNIYGDVDLAVITEEVVEGVATGQVYKDRLEGVDPSDAGRAEDTLRRRSNSWGAPDVEIIIDIAPRKWTFLTQPGAFRRVVMNVFGNSIKYTSKGSITVKLDAHPAPKKDETEEIEIVSLIITDTGQGISPHYMKTKLFTPFAQESSIAPGTGLGLSLVRSIVRMLNGEINIQSTLGVGTTVTIKFPMVVSRSPSGATSSSTPQSSGSVERIKDDSLIVIQKKAAGRTAMHYTGSDSRENDEGPRQLRQVIEMYLTKWYGFTTKDNFSRNDPVDIIVVSQFNLPGLIAALTRVYGKTEMPMIAVICATGKLSTAGKNIDRNIESLSYPFGPYKLAKVIRWLLDKLASPVPSRARLSSTSSGSRDGITEVVQAVQEVKLGARNVVQQGQMMANEEYGPLMVEALSAQSSRSIEQGSGFPFPQSIEEAGITSPTTSTHDEATPLATQRHLPTPSRVPLPPTPGIKEPLKQLSSTSTTAASPTPRSPRMLLVDDNNVNLRLLHTFMQKRGYTDIHLASDGLQAVNMYKSLVARDPAEPPDIIFMDISMPVMNGFQATRTIRDSEAYFRAPLDPLNTPPMTMIIALTGLASQRDQSEAFTSGFDLYLVKPISFKSVAKLLDSWERNGGAATLGSGGTGIPHGAVTADDVASVGSLGSVSVAAEAIETDEDDDDEE